MKMFEIQRFDLWLGIYKSLLRKLYQKNGKNKKDIRITSLL